MDARQNGGNVIIKLNSHLSTLNITSIVMIYEIYIGISCYIKLMLRYKFEMSGFSKVLQVVFLVMTQSRQQRALLAIVIATIAATAVGSAVFPVFFSLGIDALTDGPSGVNTAVTYILAFGIGFVIVGVLEQIQWLTFGPMNLRLQRHLTTHVFEHAISLPYYRLKTYTTYEIGRSVEKGLDAVRDITSNLTFFLIPTIVELVIAASVIAFMIDKWIAGLLVGALLLYGFIANVAAERIRSSTEVAMQSGIDAWSFGLDGVANAELVQQSNLTDDFTKELNERLKTNDRAWAITFRQRAYYGALQALIFGLVVLGVLWKGSLSAGNGMMSIGELVLLNTYIVRLLQPVETFARVYRDVHAALGEAHLLAELLAIETPSASAPSHTASLRAPTLTLRDVSIDVAGHTILSGLNFDVKPRETLFVVGPSGVGKSSLLKLLSCLTTASGGDYLFDGEPVSDSNAASIRNDIAVVQQDCLLFDWTIRENIAFGFRGSEEEIDRVIASLGLSEVISRHEAQGEPTVGERGNRLSGGEKQRVSLARALLRKPRLLLLDEATAALDEVNRKRVMKEIKALQQGSSSVFITHDISLLRSDSHVLYLQDSDTSHHGVHGDLLANNKSYGEFIAGSM